MTIQLTAEVCPYCRASIVDTEPLVVCSGCATKHHQDCYEENGGCTIFGCSCSPAEEQKLSVSVPDLGATATFPTPIEQTHQPAVAPPPPPPPRDPAPATVAELRQIANRIVPSMFGSFRDDEDNTSPPAPELKAEPADTLPKKRTTFILLGALLGAFGAHNFYACYYKKASAQLAITALTLGFASPMTWIWAIVDICTVSRDSRGVQFEG